MLDSKDLKELENKWNWGAFLLPPLWGAFNGCPNLLWTLFLLMPPLNIIVSFIAGKYGNRWSLKGKDWKSKEEFCSTQTGWLIAGCIVVPILLFMWFFTEEPTTENNINPTQNIEMKQNITCSGIEFNILRYSVDNIPPDPFVRDGYLLIVVLEVKNNGKEPYDTDDIEYCLRDSNGVTYSGAKVIDFVNPSCTINPGFKKELTLSFEVPSKKTYIIDVSDGSLFSNPISFKLN